MLDVFNYNFDLVAAECLKAPEQYQQTCFQSFGRDAAGQALRDPVKTVALCSKVDSKYYNNCITGGVNVVERLQNVACYVGNPAVGIQAQSGDQAG